MHHDVELLPQCPLYNSAEESPPSAPEFPLSAEPATSPASAESAAVVGGAPASTAQTTPAGGGQQEKTNVLPGESGKLQKLLADIRVPDALGGSLAGLCSVNLWLCGDASER